MRLTDTGAQRASLAPTADLASRVAVRSHPSSGIPFRLLIAFMALAVVTAGLVAGVPGTAEAAGGKPKAVIIVGPVGGLTSSFMATGRRVAAQAQAAGMDVRRIFHPAATWSNVLSAIQGASLVVYLGHGNGWPSPYGPFQEDTKNGFGLNRQAGGSSYDVEYRGADHIRSQVRLAPKAVVVLYRSCYAAGNGETWMGPERSRSVATTRVDNYAAGFLDVGAKAVFAFGTSQSLNLPALLMRSSMTMDQIFRVRGSSSRAMYDGFQGRNDYYLASKDTPGARMHLDPHHSRGHLRAVTGDLGMTAKQWRGDGKGKGKDGKGKGKDEKGKGKDEKGKGKDEKDSRRPRLAGVEVVSSGGLDPASPLLPQFSPDGDGMGDKLRVGFTLSEKAEVTAIVRDADGRKARTLSRKAGEGSGAIVWDGRYKSGKTVPDGIYTIELVARDRAGNESRQRDVQAKVVTTLRAYRLSSPTISASDGDRLARQVTLRVTLTRRAEVLWRIQNAQGEVVRTLLDDGKVQPGTLEETWDGRNDRKRYVSRGWYTATVVARTKQSVVRYQQRIWVGPYRITTSDERIRRGERLTVTYVSTEPLRRPPVVSVKQPGVKTYELDARKVGRDRYQVSFKPKTKGRAGTMELTVEGKDTKGGEERHTHYITLR